MHILEIFSMSSYTWENTEIQAVNFTRILLNYEYKQLFSATHARPWEVQEVIKT